MSMLSPKKGSAGQQAAPVTSKYAGTGGSAASSNQLSGGLKVQTSLPTKIEDKSSTPKKDADRKVGSSPAPPGQSGTPSTTSPKQTRGAYESPNSPIASASKRASGKVVSTTKPKLKAAPPAPPAAAGNTKVVSRKLELDHDSHGQNGNAVPMAGVSAPGAPAYGMNGTGGSHNGSSTGSEGKNETIFSPAYLAKQAEEKKKEEAAALAAAEKAAAESKMPRIPNSAKPKQKKKKEETKKEVQKSQPVQQPQPEEDMDDDYALDEDEFDPFLFIKNLPPLSPAMRNRKSPLPKKSKKAPPISLALDLDETLVHCSVQPIEKAELTFSVNFNGLDYEVYVRTRPHLQTFLKQVSEWFEIIVFTASQKVYADKLLNILDPNKEYIKHRVFRDSCVCVDGNYLKDLTILGRDLKKVAIVDNSVQAFGFQLDNGIPIESWFDDDNDNELLNLIPFLRTLKDVQDVRPLIRQTFRLQEFVNSL